jgi:type II secretory pathway pseudopilin PulG
MGHGSGLGNRLRQSPRFNEARGFTLVEIVVGLTVFLAISIALLQVFMNGATYANRSDTKAAATSLAAQVMEQIKASPDPYAMVGFTNMARTSLPLPAPYTGVVNPSPHTFQIAVTVTPDNNLNLITVTVSVYRPTDLDNAPLVTESTVLDAQ